MAFLIITLHEKCPNTELSRIQSEWGKIRTRKNSVFGHFSRSVNFNIHIITKCIFETAKTRTYSSLSRRMFFLSFVIISFLTIACCTYCVLFIGWSIFERYMQKISFSLHFNFLDETLFLGNSTFQTTRFS